MSHAGLAALLPLPVAIPLAGAALAPMVARVSARLALVASVAALLGPAGILLSMAPTVYGGSILATFFGHWGPVHGAVLGDAFAADPFGLDFALAASLIGAVLLLFTLSSLLDLGKKELGSFAALFLLLDAALIGSALTADLINLFVWFEVAALASYALTAFFLERPLALEAAFKVLVLTNIASFLVFLGASFLYVRTGGVDFAQIYLSLQAHVQLPDTIALGLLLAGFATKAGLVPFHGWLPDAHTAAPGPVSALFSGLMVNLGVVAIARVVFNLFTPHQGGAVLGLLMVIGLVSAVGGAFFALLQDDLKRLLAYDTISQMGVITVGLATGTASGVTGASYHLLNHALFKSLLFLCAGSIVHTTGATKLSDMGSLARRAPGIAIAFVFGVVAIAGLPPLNGYAGVGLIHEALIDRNQFLPLAVMLLAQILTIAALGKATWQAFFRPAQREGYEREEGLHPGMVAAFALLGGACVAFGVLPALLLPDVAAPAASALLEPAAYARAVLASGGRLPVVHVHFNYFDPTELLAVAGTLALARPAFRLITSEWARTTVARIQAVQTGSVNDYTAYLTAGLIAIVGVLLTR